MTTTAPLTAQDRMRAAKLCTDAHRCLVLWDLKTELAQQGPSYADEVEALSRELRTACGQVAREEEFMLRILRQLGEEGLTAAVFDPPMRVDQDGIARLRTLMHEEGSLMAVFEDRVGRVPHLTELDTAAIREAPLQSDDACVLAVAAALLSAAAGPLAQAAAAAGVAQTCA
ncbi:hypothetical protein [Streptomyces zingiberis]|uniref:Uncharacterized protein n=1 Tax=Streptomyces zingiberis TaxID=2053010 RepID=A0ABX1BNT4_9ACTN|nr:hypothetical protein [Streptomyces zingiberis]NJP99398.1 hypothetical protein [Streptomyces zingiberis]